MVTTVKFTIAKLGVDKFEMLLHPEFCFIFNEIDAATGVRFGQHVENPHDQAYQEQLQEARDWSSHIDSCTEGCVELTAELIEAVWV